MSIPSNNDRIAQKLTPSAFPSSPPSPRASRALRRLKSAYTLGPSAHQQSALTSHHHGRHITSTPSSVNHPQSARGRSNSDATNMPTIIPTAPIRNSAVKRLVPADTLSLDRLVRDGPPDGDISGALESVRLKILDQGIKSDVDGMSACRIYIWMILFNVPVLETDSYLALVHRGASPAYSKIRNDTFRTLATDPLFRRRVSEASLIRLLNAVAWKLHDARDAISSGNKSNGSDRGSDSISPQIRKPRVRALTLTTQGSDIGISEPGTYVQGMNVLAAPFLYAARSEAEAFVVFHRFITTECPGYVRGAMDGVHKGLALVDQVLAIVDPKLSLYLTSKGMTAELYAFPSVLTLCACTPPLPEVLRLWDFLFAYGAHLNILCIVAQLVILRNSIINSPSPTKTLRSLSPLKAETVKEVTLNLIRKIPREIYAQMVEHAK